MAGLAVAALFASACGGAPPPTNQLSESQAAIRGAEEVGAENTPKAALHLKMARDHLKNAEALMADEENEEASLVLKRAEVDAEVAISMSKETEERMKAEEAMKKVQELKREIE